MVVSDLVLGGLTKAMEGLTSQIKGAMDFAQKAEKASLALGMTFEQTNDQLGGTMEGLRGDMNQRFAGAIAGMEVGLQGNTKGIARLINQQRLTGTASASTAKAMAALEAQLGLSREQTNKLSSSLVDTGAEWQISTDKLVTAMTALEASFPAQAMAGMGDKVTGAMVELTAQLPQGMHKQLNSVMTMVMDTSMEGYERLTKLGIGGVREQLSASKNSEEAAKILEEAFKTASSKFSEIGGGAEGFYASLGVAADTFGPAAINFTTVSEAFGTRVKQEGADAEAFGQQLSVIKDEIMIPLQEMLKEFFPIIKGIGIVIGTTLRKGVMLVVDSLTKVFLKLGGFSGMIDKIKKKFGDLKDKFKLAIDITIPLLVAALATLTAMAVGLGIALFPIIWPFLAIGAAIGLVVALFQHFEVGAIMMEALNWSVDKLKLGFAELLIFLGDLIPFNDSLAEFGESLKLTTLENEANRKKNKELAAAKKAKDEENSIDNMNHSELMGALKTQIKIDKETMGLTEDIKESSAETAINTAPEIKTTPEFLDQTANMLGRSIEGILGVGRDTTAEEMLEELREANVQRAKAAAEAVAGGSHTDLTDK